MSLTKPHTIRGIPQLKDVERFLNGSFHEFCLFLWANSESVDNFETSEYIRRIVDRV